MRLGRLDLNLLVALDALFDECNVSIAAQRLHLSQSATSGALCRLREYFDDELLVQVGNKMTLTARAEELRGPVREALSFIQSRIARLPQFDPVTAERTFRIVTSDYVLEIALGPFLRTIQAEAPGISVEVMLPATKMVEELHRGELDLIISLGDRLEDRHPRIPLLVDDHVVIAWEDNSQLHAGLTADLFRTLPHVAVHFGSNRAPAHVESYFISAGINRRIVTTVPFFGAVPPLVVGTERIATLMRRLARQYAAKLPLRIYESPFPVPNIEEFIQYHYSRSQDAGLRWFINSFRAFARDSGLITDLK